MCHFPGEKFLITKVYLENDVTSIYYELVMVKLVMSIYYELVMVKLAPSLVSNVERFI